MIEVESTLKQNGPKPPKGNQLVCNMVAVALGSSMEAVYCDLHRC